MGGWYPAGSGAVQAAVPLPITSDGRHAILSPDDPMSEPTAPTSDLRTAPLRLAPLVLMAFMLPWEFLTVLAVYEEKTFRFFDTLVTATPSDVAGVVFLVLSGPTVWRRVIDARRSPGVHLVGWLLAAAAVSYAFNPTLRGLSLLIRLAVVVVVVLEVAAMPRRRARMMVAAPLVAGVAVAGVIAAIQIVVGGRIGILGEQSVFSVAGPFVRPSGTSTHPYMLAGLSLVASAVGVAFAGRRARPLWIAATGLAAIPLGLSFSRAVLVSFLLLVPLWMFAWRNDPGRHARPLVAVLVGFAVPALVFGQGWLARVDDSLTTDLDSITSQRLEITRIALEIIGDHPVVGVGPWNYALASEPEYEDGTLPSPVHNTVLLITAEMGVVAGVGYVVFLALLAIRIGRRRPAALALLAAPFGLWLFDTIPWFYPSGLLLFGLQVGLVCSLIPAGPRRTPGGGEAPVAAGADAVTA